MKKTYTILIIVSVLTIVFVLGYFAFIITKMKTMIIGLIVLVILKLILDLMMFRMSIGLKNIFYILLKETLCPETQVVILIQRIR